MESICHQHFLNSEVLYIKECTSTNEIALNTPLNKRDVLIVVTDYQLKGKGERGNFWESAASKNLLFSIKLSNNIIKVTPKESFVISKWIAVSLLEMLSIYGVKAKIKWPNDIIISRSLGYKKLSGTLIENRFDGDKISESVIGIGLNVNQISFDKYRDIAISMLNILNKKSSRTTILATFLRELEKNHPLIQPGDGVTLLNLKYKKYLYGFEEFVPVTFPNFSSGTEVAYLKIIDIQSSGAILTKDKENSLASYGFKEVKFVL